MSSITLLNAVSPVMGEFMVFHDKAMIIMLMIAVFVGGLVSSMIFNTKSKVVFLEKNFLEFFWTILPSLVLFILALPSLKLLYYLDMKSKTKMFSTVKSVGHQWYWSNQFSFKKVDIESDMYMMKSEDLSFGDYRCLETDSVLVIPAQNVIRLVVTSEDVIHSFALPSLGLKIDAVPGRINQQYFYSELVGVFYGQCSEMCGANHSFMPMTLEVYKC